MVITEPAVPNSWLLLWVQNFILATCSTCSTKISIHSCSIFSWVCQNWASERKALLAGWFFGSFYFKFPMADLVMILTVFHVTLCANTKAGKVSALCSRLHVYVGLLRKCPYPTVPTAPTMIRIPGLCLGEPPLGAHNFWILSGNTHIQFYEESQPHVY